MNHTATAHGDWRLGARQLRDSGTPFAVITVVHTRGSVPRDVGTRMLVTAQGSVGTIGGGHLEFEAITIARQRLALAETHAHRQHFALGARLGQCCGGAVELLFECDDPTATAWTDGLQQAPVLDVWLHGAGHVGRALVAVLGLLPCRVTWLDGRADAFPDEVPPNVRVRCSDEHALELDDAPPGACHLVMTHSHALDFELSLRILRRADFRYFGLIGSATKRRSFEHRLIDRGIAPAELSRMRCPIGIGGVSGKEPGVIAVAVAAQLLGLRDDLCVSRGPDPMAFQPHPGNTMNSSRRSAVLSLASFVAAPQLLRAQTAAPLEVAFLYDNPIGDVGWVRQHENGRLAIEQKLGAKVKTKYVQVPTGADSERVMRTLAQSGTKLVYGVSFGYMNPMAKVAAQFPDTVFMNAQGFMTSKNMGVYSARVYEGFYLNGMVAGRMSKSGVVGYIASLPVPEVVLGLTAFIQGMRSVNPKGTVRIVWLNTWYDPGREREAANALLSDGADILTSVLSSPVAVQVAEERGVGAVSWQSDMAKYGPKAQLSCALLDWSNPYVEITQSVLDGSWKPGNAWMGAKEGVIRMVALNPSLPADLKAQLARKEAEMKAGSFHPFVGPIQDQDGKERVAAGAVPSDDELRKIDWLGAGIQGRLPARR